MTADAGAIVFVARLFGLPVAFALDPFAPMLALGFARRAGLITDPYLLQPAFDGFASDGFLLLVSLMYIAHILADKIPPLAHLMDAVYLIVKPLAAAVVGFAMINAIDLDRGLHVVAVAIVLTGSVAVSAGLHVKRSAVRLAASTMSLGSAIPVISTVENVVGAGFAALVVMKPVVAILLACAVLLPAAILVTAIAKRMRGRLGRNKNQMHRA